MNNNFPNVQETVDFLENPDSTYTDVLYEFQRLTDFSRIMTTRKTRDDIQEYLNRLQSIADTLRSCIPNSDPKLKYFYYGAFQMQMKLLPDLFKHMEGLIDDRN